MKTHLLQRHTELPDEFILEIDNSSLEYFNTCARSAEYQLVMRHGFSGSQATRYGGAIHNFLERHLKGFTFQTCVELMNEEFAAMPPIDIDEWRTFDHALTAMTQYVAFYKQDERFDLAVNISDLFNEPEPLVEIPFRLPLTVIDVHQTSGYTVNDLLGEPGEDNLYLTRIHVYWTGKIDAIGFYDCGPEGHIPVIMDHKTTSMLGPTFFKDFELSQQVIGYVWATQQLARAGTLAPSFKYCHDFILDVIAGRKPSKSGVQNEYIRQRYTYRPEQLSEWLENVTHLVADFLAHLVRGFFPQQTKQCVGKYGVCAFHEVCTMPAQFRLSHLRVAFPRVTWSPLHKQ